MVASTSFPLPTEKTFSCQLISFPRCRSNPYRPIRDKIALVRVGGRVSQLLVLERRFKLTGLLLVAGASILPLFRELSQLKPFVTLQPLTDVAKLVYTYISDVIILCCMFVCLFVCSLFKAAKAEHISSTPCKFTPPVCN